MGDNYVDIHKAKCKIQITISPVMVVLLPENITINRNRNKDSGNQQQCHGFLIDSHLTFYLQGALLIKLILLHIYFKPPHKPKVSMSPEEVSKISYICANDLHKDLNPVSKTDKGLQKIAPELQLSQKCSYLLIFHCFNFYHHYFSKNEFIVIYSSRWDKSDLVIHRK